MSSPLLITKLHIPLIRMERVLRSRLLAQLQKGPAHKLILISAPAGYGKTTLTCEWLASCGQLSAWVSLDNGDNDPQRFWVYVLAALQNALSSVCKNLPDTRLQHNPQVSDALITDLINTLDKLQQPLILVLDDYHCIETQSIHDGLSFLLDHAPAHFHLVVATRADPPLPLARLRARSELLEMRQADLCFTTTEAADFLNHTMGLQISSDDVARITARTEGWIAGLQMAALSMKNADDVSGFIAAFTGSHHYIFDYLLDEVLERQSSEIRRFLLHTSILDQLTAPLCDALITENVDVSTTHLSDAILERLNHTNLFIIALDNERRWYRYHALFAELLRNYLGQKYAGQIPILHTRASTWFERDGLIADAIHHASMAGNWERVVALISTNIFALLEQNELSTVAKQLDKIASEKSLARPWLWIGCAWLAAYTGQLRDVDSILSIAEAEISQARSGQDQQALRGHCAAIRAFSDWVGGRHRLAEQTAREALNNLDEADFMIRCLAATILGLTSPTIHTPARVSGTTRAGCLDDAKRLKGFRLKWFNKYLASAQKYTPLREDGLAEIGLAYPPIRQMLRELGNRFAQHKVLHDTDDIFWLTQDEVLLTATRLDAGQSAESLTEKIPGRKAEHQASLHANPPMALPQMKVFGFDLMSLKVKRGRRNRGDVIKGVAASPGAARGVARILHGPEDFGQMKPGDVLVAPITTPAWTPLFAMASAIVTDVGGPLSHGSIVAREYAIPAVLGTGVATRRIHDGQSIAVDGGAGTVSLS